MKRFTNRDFDRVNDAFKQLQRLPDLTVLAGPLNQQSNLDQTAWGTPCYMDAPRPAYPSELPYTAKPSPG